MESLSNNWQKSESFSFRFPPMAELEFFCLKRYAFPKKRFPWHVEYSFGSPMKNFTSSFRYSSSKSPKTKIHWNTLFLENKHAYSHYNPMDMSNTAFETTSKFFDWVLKFRLPESEKNWWEYILIQSEKLQLWRSTRQI